MGMGQYINTFTPYTMQQIPFYNAYPFANNNTKKETAEEAEEKRKKQEAEKAAAEFLQRLEEIKQRAENLPKLEAQIKEMEEGKKELSDTIQKAQNGKVSEDGTITVQETWTDYKKLPGWKKALRATGNIVQGTWKLATGFFGYETNPKTGESEWNWKKCLKNTAIAAGCIALTAIPYVGPVISTALLTTGVVCGTLGTGKGIINAVNAESPEELDHAYQDIGAGLTIGVTSALGLRGLGKGLPTGGATNGGTGITGAVSSNAVSQFAKDATINAYRATAQGMKADRAALSTNGFWKTYGNNLKGTVPKLGKTKFETAKNNATQSIETRLNKISQELNNTAITPIKKAILEQEQTALNAQKTEIANITTKDSWLNLKSNSKTHENTNTLETAIKDIQTNGVVNINGKKYSMSKDNLQALQEALTRSKKMSKEIEQLSKIRLETMKKMAFYKKYKSEVEAFTGKTRNNRISRVYDASKITKKEITWKKALLSPFKAVWDLMMIPFKPWNYVQNSPASTFYKVEETFVPMYEEGLLTSGILAEALGMGNKPLTTTVYTKDENGNDKEEIVPVTKENIAQLEEQVKQYNEAIAKVQNEINKTYVA